MDMALSAILILVLLGIKELMGASRSKYTGRLANLLYIPVLPLLIIFGMQAASEISRLPQITG